eukprot:501859-Pelagomonas_calceolata.AAC.6
MEPLGVLKPSPPLLVAAATGAAAPAAMGNCGQGTGGLRARGRQGDTMRIYACIPMSTPLDPFSLAIDGGWAGPPHH